MKLKGFLFVVVSLLFFGCASTSMENNECVYFMLYDFENDYIHDAAIYFDGKLVGKTDGFGRLIVNLKGKNTNEKIKLSIEKNGYEKICTEIILCPDFVFYYKLGTAMQYFKQSECLLSSEEKEAALEAVNKSLEIKETDYFLYLKALILSAMNNSDEAEMYFKKIKNQKLYENYF